MEKKAVELVLGRSERAQKENNRLDLSTMKYTCVKLENKLTHSMYTEIVIDE